MTKYFYNASTTDAKYVHQYITSYKPGSPEYEHEMVWARFATKAGDIFKVTFHPELNKRVNTLEEFAEVVKAAGFSGSERFIDKDGTLYEIHQNGAFEYSPLEYDGQHDFTGINWATAWFFTEEAALAFECGSSQRDRPQYHEDLDTWSVHYHR